ncbi:hypothetical protein C8R45DRAFT_331137 [Mycena sanguinolenta]|nr:hypothetical protein C8R45DRAFT_331137 [Mycena sanguinolenta]
MQPWRRLCRDFYQSVPNNSCPFLCEMQILIWLFFLYIASSLRAKRVVEKSLSTCLFFLLMFRFADLFVFSVWYEHRVLRSVVFPYAIIHSCMRGRKVSRVLRLHSTRSSRNAEQEPHTALTSTRRRV